MASAAEVEQIRSFIRTLMKKYQVPGACVSIVYKGEVILEEGYGVTDLKTQHPVNECTQFGIGSISKCFTAVLLAALLPQHGWVLHCIQVSYNTVIAPRS